MNQIHHITHPLVQHKLTLMRKKDASTNTFRTLLNELSTLMAYEVTRDMPLHAVQIETPLEAMTSPMIDGKKLVFVPILRAGLGILDGMLNVVPGARVGHIGLYRDHDTLRPVEYLVKLPTEIERREVLVVDPMLATGGSVVHAIDVLKERGARHIRLLSLFAAPEGVAAVHERHPEVPITLAVLDDGLNDAGYILPGIGDAGDRLYGTR